MAKSLVKNLTRLSDSSLSQTVFVFDVCFVSFYDSCETPNSRHDFELLLISREALLFVLGAHRLDEGVKFGLAYDQVVLDRPGEERVGRLPLLLLQVLCRFSLLPLHVQVRHLR